MGNRRLRSVRTGLTKGSSIRDEIMRIKPYSKVRHLYKMLDISKGSIYNTRKDGSQHQAIKSNYRSFIHYNTITNPLQKESLSEEGGNENSHNAKQERDIPRIK